MQRFTCLAAAITLALVLTVPAMAEEGPKDKNEACSLLGDCGGDMVATAKSMLAECGNMMAKGEELMAKGKKIRGQGLRWNDKELENEGHALYERGKKMYDDAKTMSATCMLLIEEGAKTQKKYRKKPKDDKGAPVKNSDFN